MKYPLLNDSINGFSKNHRCVWCDKDKICEPNSFAAIVGGAMYMNRKTGDSRPNDNLDGYLSFVWHGGHSEDGGVGEYPDIYEEVEVARDVRGGQMTLTFCSTKCLRLFLNDIIDKLEESRVINK